MKKRNKLIAHQYNLAIAARQALNDKFHKWMTYYYVANGAILVAITTLYNNKQENNGVLLILAIVGVFVGILWNLSCKGYYHWSENFIYILINLEKQLIQGDKYAGVYSVFSEEVALKKNKILMPTKSANISTPKLTMLFSFFTIIGWLGLVEYKVYLLLHSSICLKILVLVSIAIVTTIFYTLVLPYWAKSRQEGTHDLIPLQQKEKELYKAPSSENE